MEVLFLWAGLLFAGLGLLIVKGAVSGISSAVRVDGEILGYLSKPDAEGGKTYFPVIAFTHPAGGRRVLESSFSSGSFAYPIGSKVTILTDLQDPTRARVDTNAFLYMGLVFSSIGLGCLALFFHSFRSHGASAAVGAVISAVILWQILRSGADLAKFTEIRGTLSQALGGQSLEESRFDRSRLITPDQLSSQRRLQARYSAISGVVLLLIAAGGFAGSWFWMGKRLAFVSRAMPAEGAVVELASSSSGHGTTWAPIVEFTPQHASAPVRFRHSVGSNPPRWRVGQRVAVLYDPLQPSQAMIHQGSWTFLIPLIPGAGGLLFGIGGVAALKQGLSSG
jgi:hypothetical protein